MIEPCTGPRQYAAARGRLKFAYGNRETSTFIWNANRRGREDLSGVYPHEVGMFLNYTKVICMIFSSYFTEHLSRSADGRIPFVKMHGLENAFVIVDARRSGIIPSAEEITRICNPNVGVGADQVLVIQEPTERGEAAGAIGLMRIFNIDGREAQACGNATRCLAYLLMEEFGRSQIKLETVAGVLDCKLEDHKFVSIELGPMSVSWDAIPLAWEVDTTDLPFASGPLTHGAAVNVGNPHVIFVVNAIDEAEFVKHAAVIQGAELLTEGANVSAVEIVDRSSVRMLVWERPGFLSRACGTGACAAVFVAQKRGMIDHGPVRVSLPGGDLQVSVKGDMAILAGPVEFCCCGYL